MARSQHQLRLLLWKDYLLRKRKPITIGGIVWATAALLSLVIVRQNVGPEPKPTCVFRARALPSAGVGPFLQSFLCTLDNECTTLDKYQEIPDYNHTRLKQYQDQFLKLWEDEEVRSMLDVAPQAAKLLATLTRTIDVPELHRIVHEGLKVSDLFNDADAVTEELSTELHLNSKTLNSFLDSTIRFDQVMKGISRSNVSCEMDVLKNFFDSPNEGDVELVLEKLCGAKPKQMEKVLKFLVSEINIRRFLGLLGDILNQMSGSTSVQNLGGALEAMLSLTNLKSYLPQELQIDKWIPRTVRSTTPSYLTIDLVYRLLDLFEPVFRSTETYKYLREGLDVTSATFNSLQSLLQKNSSGPSLATAFQQLLTDETSNLTKTNNMTFSQTIKKITKKAEVFTKAVKSTLQGNNTSPTKSLVVLLNMIIGNLPEDLEYRVSFSVTLLNRLVHGALEAAKVHLHMDSIMYRVLERHPKAMQLIEKLGPTVVVRLLDGLSDADRIEALKGKVFTPGQLFCDVYRLQLLLKMSKEAVKGIKPHLCNTVWKNFAIDVISSFGVNNASKTINDMASLVVADTLGNSVRSEFVKVDVLLDNLQNLFGYIKEEIINPTEDSHLDWDSLFKNVSNFKDIKQIFMGQNKSNLILVTVHTALSREVITQNRILDTYLSPQLSRLSMGLGGLAQQLNNLPPGLMAPVRSHWPALYTTTLTLMKDDRHALSIINNNDAIFCNMSEISSSTSVNDPSVDLEALKILCNITKALDEKIRSDSDDDVFFKTVKLLLSNETVGKSSEVNWKQLIVTMQRLYSRMEGQFGFLFSAKPGELVHFSALEEQVKKTDLFNGNPVGSLHLSMSVFSRLMDTLDGRLFGLSEITQWKQMKLEATYIRKFLNELNMFTQMVVAFLNQDENFKLDDLPIISRHLLDIATNLAPLIRDFATFIATKQINMDPVISAMSSTEVWPCQNSGLGEALGLSPAGLRAVRAAEALMCADSDIKQEWSQSDLFDWINGTKNNTNEKYLPTQNTFYQTTFQFNRFVDNIQLLGSTVDRVYSNKALEDDNAKQNSIEDAWNFAVHIVDSNNHNYSIARHLLKNLDLLLNKSSVGQDTNKTLSPSRIWEQAASCYSMNKVGEGCKEDMWAALRYSVLYVAEAATQMVADLMEYFTEISEPDANALQLTGFTKKTGLYILYDKLPNFLDALFNSFLDLEFMKQIVRADGRTFWDCERILSSLVLPKSAYITTEDVKRIMPFICPSLVHWVSVPTDENILLDIFSKSQNIYFNQPVSNYTAKFEDLFEQALVLKNTMEKVPKNDTKKDYSLWTDKWIKMLKEISKTVIMQNSNKNITKYDIFNSTYVDDALYSSYLARLTSVIYQMSLVLRDQYAIESLDPDQSKNKKDTMSCIVLMERRTAETIDIITLSIVERIKTLNDYQAFNLDNSFDLLCGKNESIFDQNSSAVQSNRRTFKQFCECYRKRLNNFLVVTHPVENHPSEVLKEFLRTFVNLSHILNDGDVELHDWKSLVQNAILSNSTALKENRKRLISYARELGPLGFLQYQQSRLNYLSLSLRLVGGQEWWEGLRRLTSTLDTPIISAFENSSQILDNIILNFANIKIVRLLKDMKFNDTKLLCGLNISEYIPDSTGIISSLKEAACRYNRTSLYSQVPPLRLAAQLYEEELKSQEKINMTVLLEDVREIETRAEGLVRGGVGTPQLPSWITKRDLDKYYSLDLRLTQDTTTVDMAFMFVNNIIDAGTLFVNSTYSPTSSWLTPWVKQINLQLIKSGEYATLICDLPSMTLEEVHTALLDNFHWDLALSEVVSGRNYTWTELNKALNQLSGIAQHYTKDSVTGKMSRISQCLINTTDDKPINQAAMYISLGSRVMHLIWAMIPHLREIPGLANYTMVRQLYQALAPSLPINVPVGELVSNKTLFRREIRRGLNLQDNDVDQIFNLTADVNKEWESSESLFDHTSMEKNLNLTKKLNSTEKEIISTIFSHNINMTDILEKLKDLRVSEFWSLRWAVKAVKGVEGVLWQGGQLLQEMSDINWSGLARGDILPTLDIMLAFMRDKYVQNIAYRLNNIIDELHPLLDKFSLERDLIRLSRGINSIPTFKMEITSAFNLTFEISNLFRDWDDLKKQLRNVTVLSDLLLDEIQNSTLHLEPVLYPENDRYHLKDYVCTPSLSRLLELKSQKISINQVSTELCKITNSQIKKMAPILMQRINFTYLLDIVVNVTVKEVLKSAGMTVSQGEMVIQAMGRAASVLPSMRETFENISAILQKEPLLQSFKGVVGVTDLIANSQFLEDAGNMMCGKPFYTSVNRFYKAITELEDNNKEEDQRQLDMLPSDYCRDLQKEVLKIGGGKILWSYAKPLLLGKILYTPNTLKVREIITRANSSFSQVGELTLLLREAWHSLTSLEEVIQHKDSLATMQRLSQSPLVRDALEKITNNNMEGSQRVNLSEINLQDIVQQFGDVGEMKKLVGKLSQMTDCISLDRFQPVDGGEGELEAKAANLMTTNEFLAGVVFLDDVSNNANKSTSISYKIRMDIDNVPSTSRIKNQFWTPGPDADFIDNLRYFRGFIQLQDIIDRAILDSVESRRFRRDISGGDEIPHNSTAKEKLLLNDWSVYTQQMPYPCWVKDDFQTTVYESQALIVAFFFCLILTISSVVRYMVWERESGNTSLMCVMGMLRGYHTLSWAISSLCEVLLTVAALCAVLKLGGILPNTNTAVLALILANFGLSIVMFCYMVTGIFHSASLGAVSAAIFYLLSFMPYIIIIAMEAQLMLTQKMIASLSMSTAFSYSILQMARYEVQGRGLQWDNLWSSPQAGDSMSAGLSIILVAIDSVLYAAIGWTINHFRFRENVKTGVIDSVSDKSKSHIGVRIEKLTKEYGGGGGTWALGGVSMDLQRGHITTLLGHNGAGKTTLIKILTGMTKPTSGRIVINKPDGGEVDAEHEETRNTIGLCPQFDVLLEALTAREHLSYYAQLKTGQGAAEVKHEVDSMLDALGLGPLSTEPVHRLSGGLRRRLCVGLAFIAHPHLVVLDEPSSGVDPVARRDIWSLILAFKAERTILLTTHHLDEAEILSDTVLIMHKGKICASGSPLSLKQRHGEGYKLTVSYPITCPPFLTSHSQRGCDGSGDGFTSGVDVIPKLLSDHAVDGIGLIRSLKETVGSVVGNYKVTNIGKHHVEINLPFLDATGLNNDLLLLSQHLEKRQADLKYSNMNLDCSSLEQVFLKLCGGGEEGAGDSPVSQEESDKGETNITEDDEAQLASAGERSKPSCMGQVAALLHKRLLHYSRSGRLLLAALALPTLFVAVAMGFSLIRPPPDSQVPLSLSSDIYGDHSAEFLRFDPMPKYEQPISPDSQVISRLMEMSMSSGNRTLQYWIENESKCECVEGWQTCPAKDGTQFNSSQIIPPHHQLWIVPSNKDMVQWLVDSEEQYIEKRYGGWSSSNSTNARKSTFVVWYNNKGQHALPTYLNTLNNAILRHKTGGSTVNITTYSHPLKLSTEQLSKATLLQHVADVGISVVLLIGFSLVPAVSAVFLVGERTSHEKRLQLLSAVHPVTYWTATLIWDTFIVLVAILLSVIVFEIFSLPVYVSRGNLPAICCLLLLYGLSSSSLVHLLEKLFTESSLANMVIFCCNVFVSVTGLTILLIIDVVTTSDMMQNVRSILHDIFLLWPGFSLGDGLVLVSRNTIQAEVLARFHIDTYQPPLSWPLLGPHCLTLFCTAVIFFTVNVAIEMGLFYRIFNRFLKKSAPTANYDDEDCDVATERYRVELATMKTQYNLGYSTGSVELGRGNGENEKEYQQQVRQRDILQVMGLTKNYRGITGTRIAVNNLTLGVRKGQCFGLLGVNGAGKSTTFSMLTGELQSSNGCIFLCGKPATQGDLCNGDIAYCPQNDALDPLLTLNEHLIFYCRIRGIYNSKMRIKVILEELDIWRYRNQRASTLSGGNKRKLCLAIALLSDATLLLLDEPTSGMDPGARQRTGLALLRACHKGRALVLSSHSLAECEALCSTAGLMYAGKLLALGTPTHLKHRFGSGHLVRLCGSGKDLWEGARVQWGGASRLLALHPSSLQLLLPPMPLSSILQGIANIATQYNLTDYSINQTSLDQVFINFSNSQEEIVNEMDSKTRPGIRLSTLERQYSQPKLNDAAISLHLKQKHNNETAPSSEENTVTKF